MKKQYREMFEEVHASDRLRMEVQQMKERKRERQRSRIPVGALVAALLAVALAGSALAVAMSPALRSWFAREWSDWIGGELSESQLLVIDSLTQKVGKSAVSGGVTVIVDSITVGDDNLWLLLKVEGADFSGREGYDFSGKDFAIQPETGSDMSACGIRDEALQKDGALWLLMEYSTAIPSDTQLSDGDYTLELTLTDLSAGEDALICEGTWSFSIPLTVESLSPVVTIDHAEVMGEAKSSEGEIYETEKITLQNIRITATGVSFQTVDDNGVLSAAAILSDGREVQERSAGRSSLDGGWYSSVQWPVPLNVEDIAAVRIGNTVLPVR